MVDGRAPDRRLGSLTHHSALVWNPGRVPRKDASAVMRAMVAAFNTGDVYDAAAAVHVDYVDHQGLGGAPMRGPTGFAAVVAAARSGYEELEVTIEDLIEDGDRAAARLRWSGIRSSGTRVDRETLEIIRVEGGKAIEHWGGRS